MKALIIGGAGFVGGHLANHLEEKGWSVAITKLPAEPTPGNGREAYDLDILAPDQVEQLIRDLKPDAIFHLAAQSSVALSWKKPALTIDVNVKGAIHVLDAVRLVKDYRPRILLIGSGEEYGQIRPEETPVSEETPVRPGNIYAATKVAQNLIGGIYAKAYGMEIMMIRAFNHIGAGQAPMFVTADFCKQVAEAEKGQREPILRVGNLSAKRDFTDVRDVVRAYVLLLEKGRVGETYNVGSGHAIAIEELLHRILKLSPLSISIETDPEKLRPVDIPIIEADTRKLVGDTGWHPRYPLEETLRWTLDDWRDKISEGTK